MYHYCTQGCSAMMVVVVVHKHHNWVKLLVAYLLCKLAQCLLVPWTPVLREGHTGQFWLSCVWIMFLKCIESSSIVTTTWGLTKDHTNRLCVLGIFWTTMTKSCLFGQLKRGLLISGIQVFVRSSMTTRGRIVSPENFIHSLSDCLFTDLCVL